MTQSELQGLSAEELAQESAAELPAREAMSLVSTDPTTNPIGGSGDILPDGPGTPDDAVTVGPGTAPPPQIYPGPDTIGGVEDTTT